MVRDWYGARKPNGELKRKKQNQGKDVCIELVHIIEFQCNPNQTKSWEEKDNTFYLCHDCWAIEIITAGLFQMICKKKKKTKKKMSKFVFLKKAPTHTGKSQFCMYSLIQELQFILFFFFFQIIKKFWDKIQIQS